MNYYLPTVSAIFLSAALSSAVPIEINGVAATVNSKVITKKEVSFHMAPAKSLLQAKYPRRGPQYTKELREAQDDVLEKLIENKIVLSELEDRGAALPDHVIQSEVRRIITEVFNGSETEFRNSLKDSGMTMRSFKESQKEKILIQAFRAQQFNDVAPATPEEISKHYSERRLKLRDRSKDKITYKKIFLFAKTPERLKQEAMNSERKEPPTIPQLMEAQKRLDEQLALAEKLAADLKNGADFDALAAEHSDGAFAQEGGLWEDQPRIDLAPGFAEIIFDAPTDQIIGPLKDSAGFTIVKVLSKNYGPAPSLSEVRDRMQQEVKIEKRAARYNKWIDTLKRKAMIDRKI